MSSGKYCIEDFHVYPDTYAGDPQYAEEYFSRCLCGKKRKVTTVKEVDAQPPIIKRSKRRNMKIVTDKGLYRMTEEYNYTPTAEELYLYYSGTHAGLTRNNPYARKNATMTTTRYTKVAPSQDTRRDEG